MTKVYVHDGSKPMRLGALMRAAKKAVKAGRGPFTVVNGAHHHPMLTRSEVISLVHHILDGVPSGHGVAVKNSHGGKVFEARRVSPSVYDDPFRNAVYTPMRVDAGIDHNVHGKIFAVGPGIVVHVGVPSHTYTFGDDMMVLRLTAGPAAGKDYYLAEHYNTPRGLKAGMKLDSHSVIGIGNGPIEMGWSDGVGSLAWNSGTYREGQRSALGENFNALLVALGSKSALALGRPVTGHANGFPKTWKV